MEPHMFPMTLRMPLLLSFSWQLHFALSTPALLVSLRTSSRAIYLHDYNTILDLTPAHHGNTGSKKRSTVFKWSGKKEKWLFCKKILAWFFNGCLFTWARVIWAAWVFSSSFFSTGFALHTKAKPSWIPFQLYNMPTLPLFMVQTSSLRK